MHRDKKAKANEWISLVIHAMFLKMCAGRGRIKGGVMSREGGWKCEVEEEEQAVQGEPQVRGRQPLSSELITTSISPSNPERREGAREGAGGSAMATGKGKLIIGL